MYQSVGLDGHSKLISFFVTRNGIILKDTQTLEKNIGRLVSVSIPNFVYSEPEGSLNNHKKHFNVLVMREYQGIALHDPVILSTVTNFCYNLAAGNVEEAMKEIKLIKNDAVWESMALMCIKKRKIKLAKICFAKLKNVKALRTIASMDELDDDSIAIQMYIQLGKYEDAKELMESSKKYELLCDFYQGCNKWDQVLEISAAKNRLNLPLTFYNFAKHLSDTGDQSGAIAAYEKSSAPKVQIARMLMKDQETLENYILSSKNSEIIKWGAQNAESHGDYETALKLYNSIDDICSIVRLHCLSGDIDSAIKLANAHPNNQAALYYIANNLEHMKRINEAISYYSLSGSFGCAIRLAKEHKIDKELMQLALKSSEKHMNDVAKYFEKSGFLDKAATLYSKSKCPNRALELCLKIKNITLLESIAMTLDPKKDQKLLLKAAKFLAENDSHEAAMNILVIGQQYSQVLRICEERNIKITGELIDKFEFPKSLSPNVKKEIFIKIADICYSQGSYHLASKQYALAGDRTKAIASLLKSGDKDKIITFASKSSVII